ncbi:hypothetical protein, partial [Klebsiella pneumoniae]
QHLINKHAVEHRIT